MYRFDNPLEDAFYGEFSSLDVDSIQALHRGEWQPRRAIRMDREYAGPICDVIWETSGAFVVRHKVAVMLEHEGIRGWKPYPVLVNDYGKDVEERFVGISITGRTGPLDYSLSDHVSVDFPGGKFPMLKGEYFDPESWDGSDMFLPTSQLFGQFAVAQVKDLLEKHSVTNIEFERVVNALVDPDTAELSEE